MAKVKKCPGEQHKNAHGELVGINVAVREGASGIAFSIHSFTVMEVMEQAFKKKN